MTLVVRCGSYQRVRAPQHRQLPKRSAWFAAAVTSLSLSQVGCATVRHVSSPSDYCAPPAEPAELWSAEEAKPGSSRVDRVAALLGVSADLVAIRGAAAPSTLEARLRAFQRLEVARAIVDATVAELDCEGERAAQLASYLEAKEQDLNLLYTASSIVAGAATGTASAFLAGAERSVALQEGVAVGGGAVTAGLGLVPLFQHSRVEFAHPRNLLADIWNGPAAPSCFPKLVWAYLSRPEFSNAESEPIRVRMIARWRQYETIQSHPSTIALLFGSGGVYDLDTLRRRSDMLDQVKAEVDLMNQDLAAFAAALSPPAR